ncbi:phage terminase small subunit-related protein [Niallia taxi]|uniref:phage terminase small subunit-related protein n=1 Tax=Niallia taxi TaxID=2499688 RepID=UPI00300A581C
MAKARDYRRDKAFEIWSEHNGDIQLIDIANELGISSGTVRGWKSKDKWHEKVNGALFSDKDLNAKGAPIGNSNAVKTGEYKTIFDDVFDDEELEMFAALDLTDVRAQLEETVRLYAMRERLLLKQIAEIKHGIGIADRVIVQKRMKVNETIKIKNKTTGTTSSINRENYKLVIDSITEKEKAQVNYLLKLEDSLTKVQKEKTKALLSLMDLH